MRRDPTLTPAGDRGVLVDFEEIDLGHLHAAAHRAAALTNLEACIVGHSSLLLLFRARPADAEVLWAVGEAVASPAGIEPRTHVIDVSLAAGDAPDLGRLLEHLDSLQEDFVAALEATRLRARFLGFRAGFAYLEGMPRSWHLPRRSAPRSRVPAGSLGIAGPMAGFYPIDSPGGWNLIGRASASFWDPWRDPPGLIGVGDEIRVRVSSRAPVSPPAPREATSSGGVFAEVIDTGQATMIVGGARISRYAKGLPCGGAFDAVALEAANRAVGNDAGAAALEIAFVGPRLRFESETLLSWAGAPADVTVNGRTVPNATLVPVAARDVVAIGRVAEGARGVLAVRGGIADPAAPFAVAPELLRQGDLLKSAAAMPQAPRIRQLHRENRLHVRVVAGPHHVSLGVLQQIVRHPWAVTLELDRVAVRLRSDSTPPELPHDLPSCGMQFGTVQWHPNGELVVMGPDHPITGGYLQPVTVVTDDHWKIAQLAPGERVRFEIVG